MATAIIATEASLQTLQVTIQSMTVKGKQLTLAVFRQFPLGSSVLDDVGRLRPWKMWGQVRYRITDEGDRWIVVESEGKLYRCPYPSRIERVVHRTYDMERQRRTIASTYLPEYVKKETDRLERMVSENVEQEKFWSNSMSAREILDSLPQLFIAV